MTKHIHTRARSCTRTHVLLVSTEEWQLRWHCFVWVVSKIHSGHSGVSMSTNLICKSPKNVLRISSCTFYSAGFVCVYIYCEEIVHLHFRFCWVIVQLDENTISEWDHLRIGRHFRLRIFRWSPKMAASLEAILAGLLVPDNKVIQEVSTWYCCTIVVLQEGIKMCDLHGWLCLRSVFFFASVDVCCLPTHTWCRSSADFCRRLYRDSCH